RKVLRRRLRTLWMTSVAAAAAASVVLLVMRPGAGGGLNIDLGGAGEPRMRMHEMSSAQQGEPRRLEGPAAGAVAAGGEQGDVPAGAPVLPGEHTALAFDRQGDVPVYRRGDPMRIGFKLALDGAVQVVEEGPEGGTIRLFPNRFQSSPQVPAQTLVLIPPAGQ